jgi:sugar-specific transcriptional regulator TrmB
MSNSKSSKKSAVQTSTDEDIQALSCLGLTISQAKVYFALTQVEDATIKAIAQQTKIARQDIYRTMLQLQEIGIVEKVIVTPNRYRAIPISAGIGILTKRKEKEFAYTQKKATQLLLKYRDKNSIRNTGIDTCQFILVPPKEAHHRTVIKTLENSKKLYCLTSFENAVSSPYIYEELLKKFLRKGKIRYLTCGVKSNNIDKLRKRFSLFGNNPNFKGRFTKKTLITSLLIFDNKKILITSISNRKIHPDDVDNLWTNSPIIVGIVTSYFEKAWIEASKL